MRHGSHRDVCAQLRAARVLLLDARLPLALARSHLFEAWRGAFGDDARASAESSAEADPAQALVVEWIFEEREGAELPDRHAVLQHVEMIRAAASRGDSAEEKTAMMGRWLVLLTLLALIGSGLWGVLRPPSNPWRVRWFAEKDFSGRTKVENVRHVEFDWGRDGPVPGFPKDHWAARFDTCLVLRDATKVRFKLTSDDGSRLFANGEKIVDNWGGHPTRTREGVVSLEEGMHYLQIDYFESRYGANLELQIAFDDDEYVRISPQILRNPADPSCRPLVAPVLAEED
jgi:hypothetical protein